MDRRTFINLTAGAATRASVCPFPGLAVAQLQDGR
jgi:hypothetical protein